MRFRVSVSRVYGRRGGGITSGFRLLIRASSHSMESMARWLRVRIPSRESAAGLIARAAMQQSRPEKESEMRIFAWKTLLGRRSVIPAMAAALFVVGACATVPPSPALAVTMAVDETSPLAALDQSMEALVARVTPSVVNVTVTSRRGPRQTAEGENREEDQPMERFFGPGSPFGPMQRPPTWQRPRTERDLGSGVIISPDGYIVTNYHVVEDAVSIRVTTSNRDVHAAKLVGSDALTDIAVLKIEGNGLPFLSWGDSSKLRPGQTVLAFGNPYGFSFSVTRGIVSALNRPNPSADRYRPGQFIQTDAAINQGNSGGALVDVNGQVIGINTFLISPTGTFSGMGFAIPAAIAQPIAETLIRDGKVEHGFIGISISDVTPENAKFFDMAKARGALVSDVMPDSAGAKAGLRTGDVITELNGHPIVSSGELQMEVVLRHPGDTLQLQIARGGKTLSIPVTLEPRKADSGQTPAAGSSSRSRWGLELADLTAEIRQRLHAPDNIEGAVIRTVRSGTPADNVGLSPGDIILSVNRKLTPSPADVTRELNSVPQGQDALVLVWSNGAKTFRVMHPWEG